MLNTDCPVSSHYSVLSGGSWPRRAVSNARRWNFPWRAVSNARRWNFPSGVFDFKCYGFDLTISFNEERCTRR